MSKSSGTYAVTACGAQGISTRTRVPPPGGLSMSIVPSSAATRSAIPLQARAAGRVGSADAVVGDLEP